MVNEEALWRALERVCDPEIPHLSVVEMGMIKRVESDGADVRVEVRPTFVGCPALDIIRRDIDAALSGVEGVASVEIQFVHDPPWSPDQISASGQEKLRKFGIAPPVPGGSHSLLSLDEVPPCPYCGSHDTHMENIFGPTACRYACYCSSCQQPFEAMKSMR